MEVARAAARETVSNLNAPIEHPMPGEALPPTCSTADPGRLFTRVSHAVRQAMALETRIAAGDLALPRDPIPRHGHHPTLASQTRAHTAAQTNQPIFRLEAVERLEDELFAATDNRPIPEILAAIREVLGLVPNRPARPQRIAPAEPKPETPRASTPPSSCGPAPPRPG